MPEERGKLAEMGRIKIHPSPTADTRTCDWAKVDKQQLLESSLTHIEDVRKAMYAFQYLMRESGHVHDVDKVSDIDGFHRDFQTGFASTEWWDKHRKITRHHLLADDGVPEDVTLIDVLEMIADCVMAGMARSGSVYPLDIKAEVLVRAFHNTADMLKNHVDVEAIQ